jgi:hypothetical protein
MNLDERLDALEVRLTDLSMLVLDVVARLEAEKIARARLIDKSDMPSNLYLTLCDADEKRILELFLRQNDERLCSAAESFLKSRQEKKDQAQQKN